MTHAWAPAAGDLCDHISTSMLINVWAWYKRVRISLRPRHHPGGVHRWVLQPSAEQRGKHYQKTVKHSFNQFHRRWMMMIFLSAVFDRLYCQTETCFSFTWGLATDVNYLLRLNRRDVAAGAGWEWDKDGDWGDVQFKWMGETVQATMEASMAQYITIQEWEG